MDKIDQLIEEAGIMQKLKKFKEIFKSKKKNNSPDKAKDYNGPLKEEVNNFDYHKQFSYLIKVAQDTQSKKIAKEPNVLNFFKQSGKIYWDHNPKEKKTAKIIQNLGGDVFDFYINCIPVSREVQKTFLFTLENWYGTKLNVTHQKKIKDTFIGFNETDGGDFFFFDTNSKSVFYWNQEGIGKKDEFINETKGSNKSMNDLMNQINIPIKKFKQ